MLTAIYFGCRNDDAGHYLWAPGMWRLTSSEERSLPIPLRSGVLDSGYCPPDADQIQGRALLHRVHGYTVIAFWDRTADSRSGSNSAFVLFGTLSFWEAVDKAKESFPEVFERLKGTAVLVPVIYREDGSIWGV